MIEKQGKLSVTLVISALAVFIGYVINFLLTPYVTDRLGIEIYGFVSIAKNIVGYAGIVTIALTAFVVRFISVSYHKGNYEEAKSYYSSSIAASIVLSGSIFLIAAIIILKLEYLLNIPENSVVSIKILFLIVFFTFVVTTMTTPFSAAAFIKNKLDIVGIIKILGYIADAGVLILLFSIFKPNVFFVGLGSLATAVVTLIGNYAITKVTTKELQFDSKTVSFQKVKDMMGNGIWTSLNQLGNVLNSGLDLVISNLMLTGVQTGQIAVAQTINAMFSTLYATVFQPFQPQLLKVYASGNVKNFTNELEKTMKICGMFSNIAFAGFTSLGMLYYKLWLPAQDTKTLYWLTFIAVSLSITAGIMQPVYYISTLTLKNKLPCLLTIISGFINVVVMYFMLKYTNIGPSIVVATTTIIMLCMNLFFNPIYGAHCLKISPRFFYKIIVRHIFSAFIMVVVFIGIEKIIKPGNWGMLIFSALIMTIVGAILHTVIMNNPKNIIKLIRK